MGDWMNKQVSEQMGEWTSVWINEHTGHWGNQQDKAERFIQLRTKNKELRCKCLFQVAWNVQPIMELTRE